MCNGKRDQFHELVLHGEALVFSSLRPLRAVAEVESGSTFRETCLSTEVRKSFTNPTILHGERLLKLISQRHGIQVSTKSFNVTAALYRPQGDLTFFRIFENRTCEFSSILHKMYITNNPVSFRKTLKTKEYT